jgi:hypothetical protein
MLHRMVAPLIRFRRAGTQQRSLTPEAPHRPRARRGAWALIAIMVVASACGAFSNRNDEPIRPVTIEVKNNLTMPTQITVYMVSEEGYRQMLGDVAPSDSRTFAFTPRSYTETYRLVAQIPLARPFASQPFIIGSGMTGWIQWTMIPNIIGFWDREDTVVVPDSTVRDTMGTTSTDTSS